MVAVVLAAAADAPLRAGQAAAVGDRLAVAVADPRAAGDLRAAAAEAVAEAAVEVAVDAVAAADAAVVAVDAAAAAIVDRSPLLIS